MTRAIILALLLTGCASPQSLMGAAVIYSHVKAYTNPHCPDGPFADGTYTGLCDTTRMTPAQRRDHARRQAETMKGMGR